MKAIKILLMFMLICGLAYSDQITTNYNLVIPEQGSRDWMAKISGDIISMDTIMGIISSDSSSSLEISIISSDVGDLKILTDILSDDASWTNDGTTITPLSTVLTDVSLSSATSDKPRLTLTNTNADANSAELRMQKDSVSPADGDNLGYIPFYGDNDAGGATVFASILAEGQDVSATDEAGRIRFDVMQDATARKYLTMTATKGADSGTVQINEDAVDIDFKVASDTSTTAFVVDAGTNTISTTSNTLSGLKQYLRFNLADPDTLQTADTEWCVLQNVEYDLTITQIKVTHDADPATELTGDLKFADAFIGLANPIVIGVCDTTNGVVTQTSFNDATVPAGKCIYFSFDAAPDATATQIQFEVQYDYD